MNTNKDTTHVEQPPADHEEGGQSKPEGEDVPEEEEVFETNWDQTVETFDDLGLKEEVLRGIYGYGFEKPSQIQRSGILPVIQNRDTIAQGQSGTGKTATFTISTL
jgi:translation initiation factor 4A